MRLFNEDQGNVIRVYMVGIKFISTNKYEVPKRRVINIPTRHKKNFVLNANGLIHKKRKKPHLCVS